MLKNNTTNQRSMPRKKKGHLSATIDAGLLEWVDEQIKNFTFQSRSHALEHALFQLKKNMTEKKQ
jgi:metal-responsive CopG/Arc/MetJ family transcriptional regulator